MKTEAKTYRVNADGVWIGARLFNKNDEVSLGAREAKYLLLAGSIVEKGAQSRGASKKPSPSTASAGSSKEQGAGTE